MKPDAASSDGRAAPRGALRTFSRLPRAILKALVRGYQVLLSPWLGASCRFEPTCSAYALAALDAHGAAAGSYLALRRLARCQPLCAGGCDPVPAAPPRLFSFGRRPSLACAAPRPSNKTPP